MHPDYVAIPDQFISINKYVTIADVMLISGLPSLFTLPLRIRCVKVQFMPRRTAGELVDTLKMVIGL